MTCYIKVCCPHCGSDEVTRAGKINDLQRITCKLATVDTRRKKGRSDQTGLPFLLLVAIWLCSQLAQLSINRCLNICALFHFQNSVLTAESVDAVQHFRLFLIGYPVAILPVAHGLHCRLIHHYHLLINP
jgi:hypothetical protein